MVPLAFIKRKVLQNKISYYKPGGLNRGNRLYMPSTSTGNPIARLRIGGVDVLPFQVLNHGPPPTSRAAMSLVTSNIICHSHNIHQHVPIIKSNTKYMGTIYIYYVCVSKNTPFPCFHHIFVPTILILEFQSMYLYKLGKGQLLMLEHAM